jgi:hypothetical protein
MLEKMQCQVMTSQMKSIGMEDWGQVTIPKIFLPLCFEGVSLSYRTRLGGAGRRSRKGPSVVLYGKTWWDVGLKSGESPESPCGVKNVCGKLFGILVHNPGALGKTKEKPIQLTVDVGMNHLQVALQKGGSCTEPHVGKGSSPFQVWRLHASPFERF